MFRTELDRDAEEIGLGLGVIGRVVLEADAGEAFMAAKQVLPDAINGCQRAFHFEAIDQRVIEFGLDTDGGVIAGFRFVVPEMELRLDEPVTNPDVLAGQFPGLGQARAA